MKRLMVMAAAAFLTVTLNAMSLAEARGKTEAIIADPEVMTDVMKNLSADDRKTFVADINSAIAGMPGSAEEKSAKLINVTRAALRGVKESDPKALEEILARIYATAPLESLCALNEDLSKDVLNRAADSKVVYLDEQFTEIAKSFVNAVNAASAGSEDAAVRGGFAALTMIRASNGTPATLAGDLAALLGDSAEIAKTEWFVEALKQPANYEPMLASTKVEYIPEPKVVVAIAGAQRQEVMLTLFYMGVEPTLAEGEGDLSKINTFDNGIYTRPRTLKYLPWNPDPPIVEPEPEPQPEPPKPYDDQVTRTTW